MARRSELGAGGGLGCSGDRTWQQIQGAGGGAHLAGGDPQIPGGGGQAAVPQQQLNGADVGAGLQQMNREGVSSIPISE